MADRKVDPTKVDPIKDATLTTSTGRALSDESKQRIQAQLKDTLNAELATMGETQGLQPGDIVVISSLFGQIISFG